MLTKVSYLHCIADSPQELPPARTLHYLPAGGRAAAGAGEGAGGRQAVAAQVARRSWRLLTSCPQPGEPLPAPGQAAAVQENCGHQGGGEGGEEAGGGGGSQGGRGGGGELGGAQGKTDDVREFPKDRCGRYVERAS